MPTARSWSSRHSENLSHRPATPRAGVRLLRHQANQVGLPTQPGLAEDVAQVGTNRMDRDGLVLGNAAGCLAVDQGIQQSP